MSLNDEERRILVGLEIEKARKECYPLLIKRSPTEVMNA